MSGEYDKNKYESILCHWFIIDFGVGQHQIIKLYHCEASEI